MRYLTLDTCIWLGLLKVDLNNIDNVFEEICFWIENKHIIHITPQNIIREWDRNKTSKTIQIINEVKTLHKNAIGAFRGSSDLKSAYEPDIVEEIITKRIERIDTILKTHSEIAHENQTIYNEAIKRNFDCLAPNHSQDSFRDTVNILTLIHYLRDKGYTDCFFSTINYNDFSVKLKKHDLHLELVDDFKSANLQYIYCDEEPFGNRLVNDLRKILPNFQNYLKEIKRKEDEKSLEEMKMVEISKISNPDKDFLENIKYIDLILAKKVRTSLDDSIIKLFIESHASYKLYFLNNVGNNGMV